MGTATDIERMVRRTQRYWYEDGISDLAMGGYLLLMGLVFVAESITPQGSPLWGVWGLGWPVFLIGGGLLFGWIVKRAKARVTFPRTGFVNYERTGISRLVQLVGLALVSALVAAAAVVVSRNLISMPIVFGLAFLVAFGYVGLRIGLWRYIALGFWCFVVGLAAAAFPLTLEQSSAFFYIAAGLGSIVTGLLAWRRYNASAPPPQETGDGAST